MCDMTELTAHECRVLGVLVEKAMTTPAQYPLTLNAIVTGSNQKNNRAPVLNINEDQAFDALEGLKKKGFARQAMMTGSRVDKYRHIAKEALDIDTNCLVILTELLLRGPQTVGELRGRASRMHKLESIEVVEQALRFMSDREQPLVKQIPPAPGSRANRYLQLLCPNLHPIDQPASPASSAMPASTANDDLLARVQELEQEVARLRDAVQQLARAAGQDDPLITR